MQRRVAPGHPWYEIGSQENERYDFRAIAKNLGATPHLFVRTGTAGIPVQELPGPGYPGCTSREVRVASAIV